MLVWVNVTLTLPRLKLEAIGEGQSKWSGLRAGAVLGKIFAGGEGWPLIIWEATTAKRNYYKTNYIKHVEKLGLNYPEKIWGPGQYLGACTPWLQHRTATG